MKERAIESQDAAPAARRNSIQVIERAARVLRALEGEGEGLSLGQIAQRVGLARSTVQRIVDALSAEHFLIAATPTSGVRLGPALIRLASSASVEFDQITRPIITDLSQEVGETVDLSVLKGNAAVFTDQVQGAHRLRAVSAIGETFPLYCTANGKALLSIVSEDKFERLLRNPMPRMTPNTVTKP
ncbi:MAG TPA: helix-turn-helix domain-containing protein, partial [Steroidobacteraceae bacterium]|nr:helix-turn-helix domain-containing protein [Steroidobacteraceae bacterium]